MEMSIYDFEAKDLEGKTVKLADYKGKVLLIVNIASRCGQTFQLEGLQRIYEKYKDKGFEILAFPSNEFSAQMPENGDKITEFCNKNYGVTFKIFEKDKVKGSNAQPLYKYLAEKTKIAFVNNYPVWNFQKYLVDRNGKVVDFFNPWRTPENDRITESIEKCIDQSPVEKPQGTTA
jgi:glutathione peroxidase